LTAVIATSGAVNVIANAVTLIAVAATAVAATVDNFYWIFCRYFVSFAYNQ
jgi:hypothetical protein